MQMLDDHVVVILGGGSGLGLGVARHCREEGAKIAVVDIAADKVAALKDEFGEDVLVLQADVTSVDDLERVKAAVLDAYGRIDALIGCQGIFDGNVPLKDIAVDRVSSLFDELFRINVLGYLLPARIFVDELEKTNGAIVLTASQAAFIADGGGLMYTATKGAVKSAVSQLAFEFAPNVRVNAVAPAGIANSQLRGPAALGMEASKQSDIPKDAFLDLFKRVSLLQDLPTPEDHGPLYAFLASRHNKIMTGSTVLTDQGASNRWLLSANPHE